MVPFTKESWHGRMRACRGVGASLSEEELVKWDREHTELLDRIAPEQFDVLYCQREQMGRTPPWAEGLALRADG